MQYTQASRDYSLRVRNNEFNHENLQIGIDEAHAQGKGLYVVCNIQPHNSKLKTFIRDLKPVVEMGPDALIMSDPGLIMMVRKSITNADPPFRSSKCCKLGNRKILVYSRR